MFLLVTIYRFTYPGNIKFENDEKNMDVKNRKVVLLVREWHGTEVIQLTHWHHIIHKIYLNCWVCIEWMSSLNAVTENFIIINHLESLWSSQMNKTNELCICLIVFIFMILINKLRRMGIYLSQLRVIY